MNYEPYRQNKIESGLLYQDFAVDCCWNLLGLAVVQYASKAYQYRVGESKTGVEIKHDEKFAATGNLWIEVAEKARPRKGDYVPSGICRGDNTWLYLIGDYDTVFIFAKSFLLALYKAEKYPVFPNKTKTSMGFLLPFCDAKKYAAQILYPKASEKIGKEITDLLALGRELHEAVKRPKDGQLDFPFYNAE